MTDPTLLGTIWRRRWLVAATVLAAAVVAGLVSLALPKVYETSSKLLITQGSQSTPFDSIQAAQVTARTYSDVLSSPNVAELVAQKLRNGVTRAQVEADVSVSPVAETQLLEIRAQADTRPEAKELADTYAEVFIDYARTALGPTTDARLALADPAPLPTNPARPRPLLYILLASLLATPLGVALALLRERLDSRVRSADELEQRYPLPVLARVPPRTGEIAADVVFAESFRLLRTGMRLSAPGKQLRTLVVTSAVEGEGKTTISEGVARAAIDAGQRVLLVEADVYRPRLLELLGLASARSTRGLSSYLAGTCALEDAIAAVEAGLEVLPAGPAPPSLSGQLESERGLGLMAALAQRADLVVIDCSPLLARADAALFAARADGVVLVVDIAQATHQRIGDAVRRLQGVGARILGSVVNRDAGMHAAEYGYYADPPQNGSGLHGLSARLRERAMR